MRLRQIVKAGGFEDLSSLTGENECGKGARGVRVRSRFHDGKRIGDAIRQRGVARERNEG